MSLSNFIFRVSNNYLQNWQILFICPSSTSVLVVVFAAGIALVDTVDNRQYWLPLEYCYCCCLTDRERNAAHHSCSPMECGY